MAFLHPCLARKKENIIAAKAFAGMGLTYGPNKPDTNNIGRNATTAAKRRHDGGAGRNPAAAPGF